MDGTGSKMTSGTPDKGTMASDLRYSGPKHTNPENCVPMYPGLEVPQSKLFSPELLLANVLQTA